MVSYPRVLESSPMSHVIVYTKPLCPQCDATKKQLDKAGISYETIDMTVDTDAREKVMALGYMAAPVVVAGDDHWGGFRPDRIKALGKTPVAV